MSSDFRIDINVADPKGVADFLVQVGFVVHERDERGDGAIALRFPGPGEQPILEVNPHAQPHPAETRPRGVQQVISPVSDGVPSLAYFTRLGIFLHRE